MGVRNMGKEQQLIDNILTQLDPQRTGFVDVVKLHDAMSNSDLDFNSETVQEFGRDCHTSTDGVVDVTKYLARVQGGSHQVQQSAPCALVGKQQPMPRGDAAQQMQSMGTNLHVRLANGRRVAVPAINKDKTLEKTTSVTQPLLSQEEDDGHSRFGQTQSRAASTDALRRAFAEWEAGILSPEDFLAKVSTCGFTVTPKARQMVLVTSGATFQAFFKAVSQTETQCPSDQVDIIMGGMGGHDPRKSDSVTNRFVVQRRRALDVRH